MLVNPGPGAHQPSPTESHRASLSSCSVVRVHDEADLESNSNTPPSHSLAPSHSPSASFSSGALSGQLLSLAISDVRFTTVKPSRTILHGVTGEFPAGSVTAILGNSGSGKSSLFSILFGQLRSSDRSRVVSGRYFINGQEVTNDQLRQFIALVPQHSPLFPDLSIRESLRYLAELKLPKSMSQADKLDRVEQIIKVLDLQECADQLIGAESEEVGQRGLSGGQRRRAALAGELLSNCPILLLDEVNSGLDAFHSFTLMRLLQRVARTLNRTILLTIHQPAHELAQFFDSVLLLHHGRSVYHAQRDRLIPYFNQLNFHCPQFYNPFDYLFLRVLTPQLNQPKDVVDEPDEERAIAKSPKDEESNSSGLSPVEQERLDFLASQWRSSELALATDKRIAQYREKSDSVRTISNDSPVPQSTKPANAHVSRPPSRDLIANLHSLNDNRIPLWREIPLLFHRHFLIKRRTASLIWIELFAQALMIILGCIPFIQFSKSQSSILNRLGGTSYIVEVTGILAMFGILDHFARLRPIIKHEYWNRSYTLLGYFFTHSVIEQAARSSITIIVSILVYFIVGYQLSFVRFLIFLISQFLVSTSCGFLGIALSALFDNVDLAIQFGEVFTSFFFLLQGYYINYNNIKPVLKQLGYLVPNQYLFQALMKNEMYGLEFDCPQDSCAIQTGEAVVREMHFLGDFAIGESLGIVVALNVGLFALGYWALSRKFQ